MIDHTGIGVADVSQAARFYDAALGALGLRRVMQLPENVGTDGIGYGVAVSGLLDRSLSPSLGPPAYRLRGQE